SAATSVSFSWQLRQQLAPFLVLYVGSTSFPSKAFFFLLQDNDGGKRFLFLESSYGSLSQLERCA
ncbi:hypothetical protein, partial [Bacillus cereus]|uniref:hypothetical protein n=1 Tax=Bacillus cereus TaxID=1396 RepID=UPI0034D40A7A